MRKAIARAGVSVLALFSLGVLTYGPPRTLGQLELNYLKMSSLKQIESVLNCEAVDAMRDDLYFYDSMQGLNCKHRTGGPTVVRIYETAGSPRYVLPGWGPLLKDDWKVIVGANWFAIGSSDNLAKISQLFPFEDGPWESVPAAPPISAQHEKLSRCSTWMASSLVNFATNRAQYENDLPFLERILPGIETKILALSSDAIVLKLKSMVKNADAQLDVFLTRFGPSIKEFCRESIV